MQDTHHPQVAVIKRSKKQIVMLIPAEISLTLEVTGDSKSLGQTPPKQMVVAKALQMRM